MIDIDVDEIREVNYLDTLESGAGDAVQVIFKNGEVRVYRGLEFAEAIEILKHWTPPTA
jgi:hypothetical protein